MASQPDAPSFVSYNKIALIRDDIYTHDTVACPGIRKGGAKNLKGFYFITFQFFKGGPA